MFIFIAIFLVLGLVIGSFLNVVVSRLKNEMTFSGRSLCPGCQHTIRWHDNIPVFSFFWLKGKCRDCEQKISWQYPLVEGVTGVLFALTAYYFLPSPGGDWRLWGEFIALLGVVSLFVAIATYDLLYMEVPVSLLIWSGAVSLVFLVVSFVPTETWLENRLVLGIMGGGVVSLFFFTLVHVSQERWMGWGDVWLGGVAGMLVGLPMILFMLTASFGIGALVSMFILLQKEKGMKTQVPFTPFLIGGILVTLFLPKMFPQFMQLFLL